MKVVTHHEWVPGTFLLSLGWFIFLSFFLSLVFSQACTKCQNNPLLKIWVGSFVDFWHCPCVFSFLVLCPITSSYIVFPEPLALSLKCSWSRFACVHLPKMQPRNSCRTVRPGYRGWWWRQSWGLLCVFPVSLGHVSFVAWCTVLQKSFHNIFSGHFRSERKSNPS